MAVCCMSNYMDVLSILLYIVIFVAIVTVKLKCFIWCCQVTAIVTANLNKIIDVNYYPVETAKTSNLRHRPIGIGVQGLADTFILLGMPFDSPEVCGLQCVICSIRFFTLNIIAEFHVNLCRHNK